MTDFAARLLSWHRLHGRHDLPWQVRDPYRVWLSEIMLQQTQVAAVREYYARFLARFPDLETLAAAPQDDVLAVWSGLGYYTRARNLHKAAGMVMEVFGGVFPDTRDEIMRLPGIGRSTAAAISAFCFGRREAILDGNVKRVLTRCFGIAGFPGEKKIENTLWALAESLLPDTDMAAYTQGMMDLGATVCVRSRPSCARCPMQDICVARRDGLTGTLPTPRPRKAVPTRDVAMLLARRGREILLVRRPSSGIWGGLLSLPEFPTTLAAAACLGTRCDVQSPWPEFVHVFTHFRLNIVPLPVDVPAGESLDDLSCGEAHWVALDGAADLGVPAPVRTLLLQLASGQSGSLF